MDYLSTTTNTNTQNVASSSVTMIGIESREFSVVAKLKLINSIKLPAIKNSPFQKQIHTAYSSFLKFPFSEYRNYTVGVPVLKSAACVPLSLNIFKKWHFQDENARFLLLWVSSRYHIRNFHNKISKVNFT